MTANSSTNNHSPRAPVPSPWAQVVHRDPESISAGPHSPSSSSLSPSPPIAATEQATFSNCSDLKGQMLSPRGNSAAVASPKSSDSSSGNVGGARKPAWDKPLNGIVEVGSVMGAVSWPALSESTRSALSESTRSSPKSSSDSSKTHSDGSQGPVISHSPQKEANSNTSAKPNLTPNHPVRQRSMKRGGGRGGGSGQNGFSRPLPSPPPPLPPPFPVYEIPYGPPYKGNHWESRPIGGVGSQSQRHSPRRGNFRGRPRGEGPYHTGFGGRLDQDYGWNAPQSSTARDIHMPHQMVPPHLRGFIRPPPPVTAPFIPPPLVRPMGNPMDFDMASPFLYVPTLPSESFRGVPFIAHQPPPPIFFPVMDPPLSMLLLNQIEYYFSDANLVKDDFLRSKMDDQGWVPITIIANFPRIQYLTRNNQLILDSLRASIIVEVHGDKVRRRNEWRKWIPSTGKFLTDLGSYSPGESTDNMMATSFNKVALDEVTTNQYSTTMADAHAEKF